MKHLKSIKEFNKVNEQLFGAEVRKFNKSVFGSDTGSQDGESKDTTDKPKGDQKLEVKTVTATPPEARDLGSYGKFSPGKKTSDPLVVVYGGVNVGGRKSGVYMYDYFGSVADRYNLFVANDHNVDGLGSYKALKDKVGDSPSKKILYIFSGGWRPGMAVLNKYGAKEFSKIYLVDPWMGSKDSENFYVKLAKENPEKVEYYYTSGGATNNSARNGVASAVETKNQQKENSHMKTNVDAVTSLINFA
jgi:hypothetical protein